MKMYRQDLLKELAKQINQVIKITHSHRHYAFGEHQIGRQQLVILFYISENSGAIAVKDLARFLGVTPGAVTQFIDALVEKKLVRRVVNKKDRRVILVRLTAAAAKLLARFRDDYFIAFSRIFDDLSVDDLDELLKLISKIKLPDADA